MQTLNKLIFLSCTWFSFLIYASPKSFIVGGVDAAAGEFPYIVSLHEDGEHFCGASLIKKNWILTAAHCVVDSHIDAIYVGLLDQDFLDKAERFLPVHIYPHPKYNDTTIDYDFALIELSGDSNFDPIQLDTSPTFHLNNFLQQMLTTAGWGEMKGSLISRPAHHLKKVDLPLVDKNECNLAYPGRVTDNMLCAGYESGGKDSCNGDSGGPLIQNDPTSGKAKLVGVVSWGDGCARPKQYGVYSKVSAASSWIESILPTAN